MEMNGSHSRSSYHNTNIMAQMTSEVSRAAFLCHQTRQLCWLGPLLLKQKPSNQYPQQCCVCCMQNSGIIAPQDDHIFRTDTDLNTELFVPAA